MSQPFELIDFTSGAAAPQVTRERRRTSRAPVSVAKYSEEIAAQKLGVSSRTLRRWRQAGRLPFIRAGLFVWYTDEILASFLKQNTHNLRHA